MIKKIGEENPVIKTCGFSLWFIEPYGPVLLRKEEKDLDCPYNVDPEDCDHTADTGVDTEYNLVIAFDWEGCMVAYKLVYKKEKHLDDVFDKITEKAIQTIIDGVLNNVRGADGDVR